jgi:hypothetical protein
MKRICAVTIAVIIGAVSWAEVPGAAAQTATDIKGIEEGQKLAEAQIKAKLPWKVDEVTTMTDVEASGLALTYWYLVATYKYKLKEGFIDIVQKGAVATLCKADTSLKAMKLGAVYRFIYFDARAQQLGTFEAKAADCG